MAADEAVDKGLQTQLTTILRYVDEQGDVREDFIGFTNNIGDTTGKNIADFLVEKPEVLDLSHSDM